MSAAQPPKFSRYRSVRKAGFVAANERDAPPVPTEPVSLSRAPSRYHRSRRPAEQTVPSVPTTNVSTEPVAAYGTTSRRRQPTLTTADDGSSPPTQPRRTSHDARDRQFVGGVVELSDSTGNATQQNESRGLARPASSRVRPETADPRSYEAAREEARMILEGEYDRLRKTRDMQQVSEHNLRAKTAAASAALRGPAKKSPPRPAVIDESKATDAGDAAARHNVQQFFDAPKPQVQRRPTVSEQQHFIPAPQSMIRDQAPKSRRSEDNSVPAMAPVLAKFDAPISAVNAGERRVEIRCNGAEIGITLPVTPSTSSRDLLNSASICMSESFNPRTAILIESFSQIGLERPLRRYEHVRDVMNSWDMDSQNYLTIMPEEECDAMGLERSDAPQSQPSSLAVQLHHSCKAGKWDKRWMILRSDGQVTMSKHENDGDATNICHLSDFDVYTPTRKQLKQLKPPKKMCIAVKSQQKSAMFLEGTNFVHFFATGDKETADRWYRALQSWRSWYLINVLGEGLPPPAKDNNRGLISSAKNTDARPETSHSHESIPYQLGSFQPLLDFDANTFGVPRGDVTQAPTKAGTHSKQPSYDLGMTRGSLDQRNSIDGVGNEGFRRGSRHHRGPPCAFPTKLLSQARNKVELGIDSDEQAFTGGGLLARSASRRSQTGRMSGQQHPGGAHKPLVDMSADSEFLDGSLLHKLEAWSTSQGDSQPKIDRQKRIEANVRVGEGM